VSRTGTPPSSHADTCNRHAETGTPTMADEPPFNSHAPATVTPYGAIAYRIDAVAEAIAADPNIPDEPGRYARTLWGIVDDLVALNIEGRE
jgi:hypothetical protein